jgi:hypothetical protein
LKWLLTFYLSVKNGSNISYLTSNKRDYYERGKKVTNCQQQKKEDVTSVEYMISHRLLQKEVSKV